MIWCSHPLNSNEQLGETQMIVRGWYTRFQFTPAFCDPVLVENYTLYTENKPKYKGFVGVVKITLKSSQVDAFTTLMNTATLVEVYDTLRDQWYIIKRKNK